MSVPQNHSLHNIVTVLSVDSGGADLFLSCCMTVCTNDGTQRIA